MNIITNWVERTTSFHYLRRRFTSIFRKYRVSSPFLYIRYFNFSSLNFDLLFRFFSIRFFFVYDAPWSCLILFICHELILIPWLIGLLVCKIHLITISFIYDLKSTLTKAPPTDRIGWQKCLQVSISWQSHSHTYLNKSRFIG